MGFYSPTSVNNVVCFKEVALTFSPRKALNHKTISIFFRKHSNIAQLSNKRQMKSENHSEGQKSFLALYRQQEARVFHHLNTQRMHMSLSPYNSYSFCPDRCMNILLFYRGNIVLLSSFFGNDTSLKHGYSIPAIQEKPSGLS